MATGFFTDTTLCIGCKACEVACKQWNQLPADGYKLTGMSYDNTVHLGAATWRHVAFVEQFDGKTGRFMGMPGVNGSDGARAVAGTIDGRSNGRSSIDVADMFEQPRVVDVTTGGLLGDHRWLMMSDVCKHCSNAGCLEACPTGAIVRNEFGDVYVQPDICNGCGYCQIACPFGVVEVSRDDGRAWKCTLCYDRQKDGMEPACAKACPTQSIQFGDIDELRDRARDRVGMLHTQGITDAYLYGVDEDTSVGPLNAFFLLVDEPQVYNLPDHPHVPQAQVLPAYVATIITGVVLGVATLLTFGRGRGRR
ncbi:MAG: 4Fe-4S dicluster domain-containing protein [Ktedonobacterales bacterium]